MSLTGGSVANSIIRLRGYSIRVSNTSNVSPGSADACFTDNRSATLKTVIEEDCKKTTKYIWFYQTHKINPNGPILEICEVQVSGKLTSCVTLMIPVVLYISYCICCVLHVNQRYWLHTSDLGCETGSFGDDCSRKCDHCKNSETCDIETGQCDDNGCSLSGFRPPICDGK